MVEDNFELKWNYNNYLNRYYNGCNYLEKNPEQFDLYINGLMEIKEKLEECLDKIMGKEKVNIEEILNGFKID